MFIPHHPLSVCLCVCLHVCLHSLLSSSLSIPLLLSLWVSKMDFDHFNSLIKLTGSPEKTSSCTRVDVGEVTLKWPDIYGVTKDSDDMLTGWGRMPVHTHTHKKKVESASENHTEVPVSLLKLHSHLNDWSWIFLLWNSKKVKQYLETSCWLTEQSPMIIK